jgi:hypothetical protein
MSEGEKAEDDTAAPDNAVETPEEYGRFLDEMIVDATAVMRQQVEDAIGMGGPLHHLNTATFHCKGASIPQTAAGATLWDWYAAQILVAMLRSPRFGKDPEAVALNALNLAEFVLEKRAWRIEQARKQRAEKEGLA